MGGHNSAHAAAGAILVLLAVLGPNLIAVVHDLPYGVHSWKQGDCLALAQRYLEDRSWNILDPRGLSLFSEDGRVNAELPLTAYAAAALCRLLGIDELVPTYRVVTFVVSLLGPAALFLLAWTWSRRFVVSLLPAVFLASCPVFAYYAAGFLPDAPALSLVLLGLFVLLRSPETSSDRPLAAGIGLMTLGALMKMSLAPYMVLPAILMARRSLLRKPSPSPARVTPSPSVLAWSALIVSGLVLLAQLFHLRTRAAAFGPTHFTASIHPFRSLPHMEAVIRKMSAVWLDFLFTPTHLVVLAVAVALVGRWAFTRRRSDELGTLTAVSAVVALVVFTLFGKQLAWHDYYAIAVFYPTAVLLVLRLARAVNDTQGRCVSHGTRLLISAALLAVMVGMAGCAQVRLAERRHPWFRENLSWQKDARGALDRCGPPCGGPVAVLGVEPPNLSLTYLERRGYVLGPHLGAAQAPAVRSPTSLAAFLDARDVDVVVCTEDVMPELLPSSGPALFRVVEREGDARILLRAPGTLSNRTTP